MIGIINIEMGNLRSVSKAVEHLGFDVLLVEHPNHLDLISHLIVPGVGSYRTAMQHIGRQVLLDPIRTFASNGRPILGLCLGMQLLSSMGEEGGECKGLGLIDGLVRKLDPRLGLALPHVGWNGVSFLRNHPVFRNIKTGRDYYFVHSYQFVCDSQDSCLGITEYGGEFPSIVGRENILGFQFHPEKSQSNGLRLLENFCNWDGGC